MSGGIWEQHAAGWWAYRIPGQTRPEGYVLQGRPNGDPAPVWEAVILSRPISTAIVAHDVTLAQAKNIIEQEIP